MLLIMKSVSTIVLITALLAPACPGADAQKLTGEVAPSLVIVQYIFQNELGRHELRTSGIVVGEDGLVMTPMTMFPIVLPDDQMKEFKILVPRENADPQELDAIFQGRDQRTNTAFIKTKESQHWKAMKFEEQPVKIGDPIYSVGLLPKPLNYKSYFVEGSVSASLNADVPQVLVTGGGLATPGSPVFDNEGRAVGIVSSLLSDAQQPFAPLVNPPKFYTPTREFLLGIQEPPTPDKPIILPWMGVSQMSGVSKDLAEVLNLSNQAAIQIGDVIAGAPADKAGLKAGDIIVKVDGKPLERGDEATEELPSMLTHRLRRLKPGEKVTLSILRDKDQPVKDVEITLGKEPEGSNLAKRFWAEDLGFDVRDLVFTDLYALKLPSDQKGVIVSLLRPQAAAQTGGLKMNDVITRLNNDPVTGVAQFQKSYQQIRKDKPKEAVVLEVRRGDRENTVRIEPPQ
jgi:serine protease Do